MTNKLTYTEANSVGDAQAIRHFQQALASGKNWFIALLEAMGLWTSTEETFRGRTYRYLIDKEAFDWLLLAERLCNAVDGLPQDKEREALIFQGCPPLRLSPAMLRRLIGQNKYRQYLNYFYGITLEGMLVLAVHEEVQKEWRCLGRNREQDSTEEAYRRIYGQGKSELLKSFRKEKGYPQPKSITLTELKEFTYWLFKLRLKTCEKARVASDTRKALLYLKCQWAEKGIFGVLATEDAAGFK